ncbi:MAG: hypothetical protein KDE27_09225 [Planctomycetes bacterium]|nr:hypothetical protein [Planctomycetota bacterium]
MPILRLALAAAATVAVLPAQDCASTPFAAELRTYDPWRVTFFYGTYNGGALGPTLNLYFDLEVARPIEISALRMTTYDQGASSGPPDQLGNVAEVRIYLIPTTRVGNESSPAGWGIDAAGAGTADGLPEALGELTVVAWPGDSPIANFKDPVTGSPAPLRVPAGQYGVCVELIPTDWNGTAALPQTNVPLLNPGSLHTIGVSPNPGIEWSDQFVTLKNDGIQQFGWYRTDTGGALIANPPSTVIDSINLAIEYEPEPTAALSQPYGAGCYDRPWAFYDLLPENAAAGCYLENSAISFLPQGAPITHYLPVAGPAYTPPGASAIPASAGSYSLSTTASWDDACDYLILGFVFPYPGGSASQVTYSSNGKVYLGGVPSATQASCGASYGDLTVFRDGLPAAPLAQWCAFFTDLDPSSPLMPTGGGVFYERSPTSVRFWWHDVPNWPAVAGELCRTSLTLHDSGRVDLAWETLHNSAVGSGNAAIVGFSRGNGEPIGAPVALSTLLGVPTGDGALAPQLALDGRPVAGAAVDVVASDLFAGTTGGFVSLGFGSLPAPGLALDGFGMPGCAAQLDLNAIAASVFLLPNAQNELRWSWQVPTGFQGLGVYLQAGTLTPGFNPAGILVTNALCAKLGN